SFRVLVRAVLFAEPVNDDAFGLVYQSRKPLGARRNGGQFRPLSDGGFWKRPAQTVYLFSACCVSFVGSRQGAAWNLPVLAWGSFHRLDGGRAGRQPKILSRLAPLVWQRVVVVNSTQMQPLPSEREKSERRLR